MYYRMIKRRIVSIIAALVFLLAVSGCASEEASGGKEESYMRINAEKAKEMMENLEEFVLLDARTEEEFSEGHIPGAIVIPHDEIFERAEAEIPEKDVPVFVYCRSGNRSKTASKALVDLGYSEVYEFGGIIDWPYEIEQ
ncbi:MAG: rhodanese-like domain-containing protein [Oscillospiraceae bacterium]|nr:rhodanese-like domain-containing protein [Oscillospiraceae bacterium]